MGWTEPSEFTKKRQNLLGVLRIILEMLRSEAGWEKIDHSELYFDSLSYI